MQRTGLQAFQAPPLALLLTEPLRAALEFCAHKVAVAPRTKGDGHPVIVYPGLAAGSLTTAQLRRFLGECGFTPYDWELGINTGPAHAFDDWLGRLVQRVHEVRAQHGRKVSLVGWSLGGVYAREIARAAPDAVRQVITLGTPFASLGGANHAGTVYRMLGGDTSQLTPELEARLRTSPPVPTTSIFSKADGVVCWRGCLEQAGHRTENVEVDASHLGMGSHPEVLRIVAERLAQKEGRWKPHKRHGRLAR